MSDANVSVTTLNAASFNSQMPISEYMKKEFFYSCVMTFEKAMGAEPIKLADEIRS